ncbi:MAG: nucleoside transporter C-terminal domain-containing protein [Bacteroidota bacterium]
MDILRSLLGLTVLLGIAYIFSLNRRKINWRLVLAGVGLQLVVGVLLTKVPPVVKGLQSFSAGMVDFLRSAYVGSAFLVGDLADESNFRFAFMALAIVIFFSTVTAGLYYLGILQKLVYAIAWVMSKTMRLSGAESLSAAGNIFLGQTEAPLLVRPFIPKMTKSELMALMTGGMATIAGSVFGAYVGMLGDDPQIAAYLLTASFMNAPAALVMAKILVPESNPEEINTTLEINKESLGVNLIDALAKGASDGVKLAANIGAMLLAFVALIAAINLGLGGIGNWIGVNDSIANATQGVFPQLSLEYLLGQAFRPIAWLIGTTWEESLLVGSMIGQKTAINEFVAYSQLGEILRSNPEYLSAKSVVITSFALCGFSNFSSIAIQIGGIGSMAPNQTSQLSKLGMRALLGATMACLMTAAIAGALFSL